LSRNQWSSPLLRVDCVWWVLMLASVWMYCKKVTYYCTSFFFDPSGHDPLLNCVPRPRLRDSAFVTVSLPDIRASSWNYFEEKPWHWLTVNFHRHTTSKVVCVVLYQEMSYTSHHYNHNVLLYALYYTNLLANCCMAFFLHSIPFVYRIVLTIS
jgi:hypothetical protein